MCKDALAALEPDAQTTKRAQYEAFEFSLEAPGLVRVTNGSYGENEKKDHSYRVNVESGVPAACECKAFEYQDGACKHLVAIAIREPVLEAAADYETPEQVATDGGQLLEVAGDDEDDAPYTVHTEPPEQGGEKFARCTDCEREILPVGRFEYLTHADDCQHGNVE